MITANGRHPMLPYTNLTVCKIAGNRRVAIIYLTELQIRCIKLTSIDSTSYFFTKSYVWPLVRIVSKRRFYQVVKHRIWWRNSHQGNKNTHLILSPVSDVKTCNTLPRLLSLLGVHRTSAAMVWWIGSSDRLCAPRTTPRCHCVQHVLAASCHPCWKNAELCQLIGQHIISAYLSYTFPVSDHFVALTVYPVNL